MAARPLSTVMGRPLAIAGSARSASARLSAILRYFARKSAEIRLSAGRGGSKNAGKTVFNFLTCTWPVGTFAARRSKQFAGPLAHRRVGSERVSFKLPQEGSYTILFPPPGSPGREYSDPRAILESPPMSERLPGPPLGSSWGPLGPSWGPLGPSWEPFGGRFGVEFGPRPSRKWCLSLGFC